MSRVQKVISAGAVVSWLVLFLLATGRGIPYLEDHEKYGPAVTELRQNIMATAEIQRSYIRELSPYVPESELEELHAVNQELSDLSKRLITTPLNSAVLEELQGELASLQERLRLAYDRVSRRSV